MSTGLFYLSSREFSLQPAKGGIQSGQVPGQAPAQQSYNLVHKVPGICFVLFYSKSCEFCKNLMNDFKALPGKVNGVNFAMANVSADNMRLHQMSQASTTPIQYVPYLVVYVNGEFYMEYRGSKVPDQMVRALYEISMKISQGREFSNGRAQVSNNGTQGYYDGSDDSEERCVFTYDEAYNGKVCDLRSGVCFTYDEAYNGKICDEASGKCYTYDQAYNGKR